MSPSLSDSQIRDAEALLHPHSNAVQPRETGARIVERGEGIRVFGRTGEGFGPQTATPPPRCPWPSR